MSLDVLSGEFGDSVDSGDSDESGDSCESGDSSESGDSGESDNFGDSLFIELYLISFNSLIFENNINDIKNSKCAKFKGIMKAEPLTLQRKHDIAETILLMICAK